MGLDVTKLRSMQADIKKTAGQGGDNLFLYANKLSEADDIRILEPRENLNGAYFVYQEGWWIAGKFYLTGASLGGADVIDDEIEKAKLKKDKELNALLNAKATNGAAQIKREVRYLVPILQLDCTFDKNDQMVDMSVKDDGPKILVAKPTLLTAINTIVTSRQYQNNTANGIADRVKGWNITVGKSGKGLDTTYSAIGWTQQMEMDEKYYGDKVPDVYEISRKGIKSDDVLRSIIRNYLYGEAILEESAEESTPATEEAKEAPTTAGRGGRGTAVEDAEVLEETPFKKMAGRGRGVADTTAHKPTSRSLVEDAAKTLEGLDD